MTEESQTPIPRTDDAPTAWREQAAVRQVELLAPAGDWECARAAIANGADAVYFGLDIGFNARARATNLSLESLPQFVELLHRYGVRGYLTLNTLIFPSELRQFEDTVRQAAAAGVDAVLIQDLGAVRLVRAICPELPIHASTQMTLTNADEIRMVTEIGVDRVVLPRELSLDEIREVRRNTKAPVEVFVHGALCVAYSGQCLTSESLGGRSANRGQCAQACRLPYDLICDGRHVDLAGQHYLLSPQDLAAFSLVPELIAAGVAALKIEGRLKTPEYVANITRHYRRAMDESLVARPVVFSPADIEEMELSFSRGFSPGWLRGCDHKMLVPGLSSAKRGVRLGVVSRVGRDRVAIALERRLRRGDGVVFSGSRLDGHIQAVSEAKEQGGRVYEIFEHGRPIVEAAVGAQVELAFAHGAIDFTQIAPGREIWKTNDPQLTERLRKSFAGDGCLRRWPLDIQVVAAVGRPLVVRGAILGASMVEVVSEAPLAAAERHPLTEELLHEQFSRLGKTDYQLRSLTAHIDGRPMAPLSVLGKLRRELVAKLDGGRQAAVTLRPMSPETVIDLLRAGRHVAAASFGPPVLRLLVRSLAQLRSVLELGVRDVIAEFMDIREYAAAVAETRRFGASIFLATPRIEKPGEQGILRAMLRHDADGILARNLAAISRRREHLAPVDADYSLNVTNDLAAEYLIGIGARRVTASYDLNREQLLDLVAVTPADWLEVVIHQQMPMFHMEHCVFCAVLSPGTNKHNCGRPCDRHDVKLRDRIGIEHPLRADVGCRNTLFNATPQSAAEVVPALLEKGVRHFRVELLDDRPKSEIATLIELYSRLLSGEISGQDVWTRLKAANRVGVTRGSLEARRDPLAII